MRNFLRNIQKDMVYRQKVCLEHWHFTSRQTEFDKLKLLTIVQTWDDLINRRYHTTFNYFKNAMSKSKLATGNKRVVIRRLLKNIMGNIRSVQQQGWLLWKYSTQIAEARKGYKVHGWKMIESLVNRVNSRTYSLVFNILKSSVVDKVGNVDRMKMLYLGC
jgi:hypothetical protein